MCCAAEGKKEWDNYRHKIVICYRSGCVVPLHSGWGVNQTRRTVASTIDVERLRHGRDAQVGIVVAEDGRVMLRSSLPVNVHTVRPDYRLLGVVGAKHGGR
jgi:hypothetical protein